MKLCIGDVIEISFRGNISHKVHVVDITTGHITLYYPAFSCKRTIPITMLEGKSVRIKYDEKYLRDKIEREVSNER